MIAVLTALSIANLISVLVNITLTRKIIMNNTELLAALNAANAKADKITTEIQALKDLVNETENVPQEIVDAVNSLTAKLQAADDLNDDAATPTDPEQPTNP